MYTLFKIYTVFINCMEITRSTLPTFALGLLLGCFYLRNFIIILYVKPFSTTDKESGAPRKSDY